MSDKHPYREADQAPPRLEGRGWKILLSLGAILLTIVLLPRAVISQTVPTISIESVIADEQVTFRTAHYPVFQTFTVRMGPLESRGIDGPAVDTFNSGKGGTLIGTFPIPDTLKGRDKIAIRVESAQGYFSFNWFYNRDFNLEAATELGSVQAVVTPMTPQPLSTGGAQAAAAATSTATATPESEQPAESATETPVPESDATEAPEPTTPAEPTEPAATPEPTATPETSTSGLTIAAEGEVAGPIWLNYVNYWRSLANAPLLVEDLDFTEGSNLHSRYMIETDHAAHFEHDTSEFATEEGEEAAEHGNIFVSPVIESPYTWAINFWVSAPFHLVPMLDPRLERVGFAINNLDSQDIQTAATLDVLRGRLDATPEDVSYPLAFPQGETWIVRHSLFEFPDPIPSCPGYSRPAGAPIVLLLGEGDLTPRVTSHSLRRGDEHIEHCIFDESTYTHPDEFQQERGRTILNMRDAVVILPRQPLTVDETYTVDIAANGETYSWQFRAVKPPAELPK